MTSADTTTENMMNRNLTTRLPLILTALLLTACSSKFERVALPPDGIEGGTLGVLPVNFIDKPSARVDKNLVKFAGTLGRAAVIKAEDAKRRKLTEGLAGIGYVYQEDFDSRLAEALTTTGFQAQPLEFSRTIDNILEDVPPGRFEKRYPQETSTDFLLDIYIEDIGFVASGLTADYLPVCHLGVRVVNARSLETVYQTEVQYNPEPEPDAPVVAIAANKELGFKGIDALLDNPEQARVALSAAIHAAIDALVAELEK